MSALLLAVVAVPDDIGGKYVAGAYIVFVVLLLIYLAIMAMKLARIERDLTDGGLVLRYRTEHTADGLPPGAVPSRPPGGRTAGGEAGEPAHGAVVLDEQLLRLSAALGEARQAGAVLRQPDGPTDRDHDRGASGAADAHAGVDADDGDAVQDEPGELHLELAAFASRLAPLIPAYSPPRSQSGFALAKQGAGIQKVQEN